MRTGADYADEEGDGVEHVAHGGGGCGFKYRARTGLGAVCSVERRCTFRRRCSGVRAGGARWGAEGMAGALVWAGQRKGGRL